MSEEELMAELIRRRDELHAQGTRAVIVGTRLAVGRDEIRRAVVRQWLDRRAVRESARQQRDTLKAQLEGARLERYQAQREAREAQMPLTKAGRILAHQEARRQRQEAFRARRLAAGPQGIAKAVKAGRMANR